MTDCGCPPSRKSPLGTELAGQGEVNCIPRRRVGLRAATWSHLRSTPKTTVHTRDADARSHRIRNSRREHPRDARWAQVLRHVSHRLENERLIWVADNLPPATSTDSCSRRRKVQTLHRAQTSSAVAQIRRASRMGVLMLMLALGVDIGLHHSAMGSRSGSICATNTLAALCSVGQSGTHDSLTCDKAAKKRKRLTSRLNCCPSLKCSALRGWFGVWPRAQAVECARDYAQVDWL